MTSASVTNNCSFHSIAKPKQNQITFNTQVKMLYQQISSQKVLVSSAVISKGNMTASQVTRRTPAEQ